MESKTSSNKINFRLLCRNIHRDLSFFLTGVILVYAVSGITFNHLKDFNPNFVIETANYQLPAQYNNKQNLVLTEVNDLLQQFNISETYLKHYSPKQGLCKIFLSDRAFLEIDFQTGAVQYEGLKKRPVFSQLAFLHYNPNKWWTWFSDAFAVGLIVICLTGIFMLKGKKGLIGRGGVELILGISIPILFLIFS